MPPPPGAPAAVMEDDSADSPVLEDVLLSDASIDRPPEGADGFENGPPVRSFSAPIGSSRQSVRSTDTPPPTPSASSRRGSKKRLIDDENELERMIRDEFSTGRDEDSMFCGFSCLFLCFCA